MDQEVKAKVWVICRCGERHILFPGIDAPIYWCSEELKKLVPGDEVEYEEVLERGTVL